MLKPKVQRFCEIYLSNGSNPMRAALEAGYGHDDEKGRHTASVTASRLLKKPEVQEYLQTRSKEICREIGISPERIAAELWKMYQRCTQAVEITDKDGEGTGEWVFDAKNALQALKSLGEYEGMFTQKVDAAVHTPFANASDDTLRELIAKLEGGNV